MVFPMKYDLVMSELQQASTFDLFRLQQAIGRLLDDPQRMSALKRRLKPGMDITYFDSDRNSLVPVELLEVHRTRASVREKHSGTHWTIPLYMINVDSVDTDIVTNKNQVDRLSLKTGDQVGFTNRDGEDVYGTVVKLNPKRAKIKTRDTIWAVPYSMLFTVIDGELAQEYLPAAKAPAGIEPATDANFRLVLNPDLVDN